MGGLKFFRRILLACLQEVTNSLRLLKVTSSGPQMMKYFLHRHKSHLIEAGLKGDACFKIFQVTLNFSLQLPNMLTETLFAVVKRRFVICKSGFERVLSESDTGLD